MYMYVFEVHFIVSTEENDLHMLLAGFFVCECRMNGYGSGGVQGNVFFIYCCIHFNFGIVLLNG